MIDYAGCLHFHSSYSYDSQTPVKSILESALAAGLDFAILTDHFRLEARHDGWEGYYCQGNQRVLLIVGEEISPRYNHYLALNIKTPIVLVKRHPDAQSMIDRVNDQGGFGFIAHPDQEGAPLVGVRAYPWVSWAVHGFAGLSIWELMGDWTSNLSSPWSMLNALLRPAYALRGPRAQTLARWDQLAQQSHCVAVGELDNHGNRRSFWGFSKTLFPFEFAFRTIRTHALLDQPLTQDAARDIPALLEALRQGRSYVSFDLWNDPRGFSFETYDETHRASMGGEFRLQGPALLEAKIPGRGRIRLIRNGRLVWEERRAYLQRDLDLPGVYRVQVDQRVAGRWRPWIFSNPIWVK